MIPLQRGFSLLELLLATMLLALAIGLTAATVRGVARGQIATEARLQVAERRDGVANALRERLSTIVPVPFLASDGSEVLFIGTAERMEFVGSLRAYAGPGGEFRQTLQVIPTAEGKTLCLRAGSARERSPAQACEPGPQTTVADALASVRLRYRGHDPNGRLEPWSSQWMRTGSLPEWVEITLAPMQGKPWPPVVVRLPMARSPGT